MVCGDLRTFRCQQEAESHIIHTYEDYLLKHNLTDDKHDHIDHSTDADHGVPDHSIEVNGWIIPQIDWAHFDATDPLKLETWGLAVQCKCPWMVPCFYLETFVISI